MAQRFGGEFSPQGKSDNGEGGVLKGKRRSQAGGRVNLLFIVPLVLIWPAFTSDPTGLALYLAALGLLLLAAWLTREGILAQEAYEARKLARRPKLPRKIFASVLTGMGLGLAGFAGDGGLFEPLIFAITGAVLHSFAFGVDPMEDKGMEGVDLFQTDRVARAVEEAEKHLSRMTDAIKRAGERNVEARVDAFVQTARTLFRTVEEDPRDLTAARKYLSVYLQGARDATVKFADIYSRGRDPQVKADYLALLDDLEGNFAARTEKLMRDDRSDLDVEIEVLRARLKQEGLRSPDPET